MEPPGKKPKFGEIDDDNIGRKLLAKMGYKKGEGLGAKKQGRAEPIEVSRQHGRRGLGNEKTQFDDFRPDVTWDLEEVKAEETVSWMPSCSSKEVPAFEEMLEWIVKGPKKLKIDDETHFCTEEVLLKMLKAKSVFDQLPDRDLRNARTRANPFETVKGGFFQNRAAMKMANMDAVFGFLFTKPTILVVN